MDIRQTDGWGNYLQAIGWKVKKVGSVQLFIRVVPFLNFSFIKIQHQENPIPFKEVDKIAKQFKSLMVLVEPALENYQEGSFIKNGYYKTSQPLMHSTTIQINLEPSIDKILASFSENARRNIKKALSHNLIIKKVFMRKEKNLDQFDTFMKLLRNLTDIKKFWIPGDDEMKKKITGLKNSILFFAYEKGDKEPIATVWLALTKNSSHYIQTGMTRRGYELLANYSLIFEVLKASKKLGLKRFDFEGIYDIRYPKIHVRWKNFSEFKSRFHGDKIVYPTSWVKFYNTAFKYFYKIGTRLP